jgi:hypothetical protein
LLFFEYPEDLEENDYDEEIVMDMQESEDEEKPKQNLTQKE